MTGFSKDSFAFLHGRAQTNNREWFNDNKSRFTKHLEEPFINLLDAPSNRLSDAMGPLSGGKATMFRMNRDVRFSKDKTPCKTNVAGMLPPFGTKSEISAFVYLYLQPGGGFAAPDHHDTFAQPVI